MALWKESAKGEPSLSQEETKKESPPPVAEIPLRPRTQSPDIKDSVIGSGLTIEGKIEGNGNVRIAGNFKGDVRVKGSLTVEAGACINGELSAENVTIGGQVEGNINASTQVNLLESCQLVGDLKAMSLTVAAGSRMRGRVEFGWEDKEITKVEAKKVVNKPELRSDL